MGEVDVIIVPDPEIITLESIGIGLQGFPQAFRMLPCCIIIDRNNTVKVQQGQFPDIIPGPEVRIRTGFDKVIVQVSIRTDIILEYTAVGSKDLLLQTICCKSPGYLAGLKKLVLLKYYRKE